jgi:hypothetical protein
VQRIEVARRGAVAVEPQARALHRLWHDGEEAHLLWALLPVPPAPAPSKGEPVTDGMKEADLLGAVMEMAALHGLRVHHCRPALTRSGQWRTPIQGDAGFVDLVLVGDGGVLFRELKSTQGVLSDEQRVWLNTLAQAGQNAGVWRPADLRSGRILAELRAIRKAEAVDR